MVNENLDTTPFWDWLLGVRWFDGALLRTPAAAAMIPLAVLAAWWAVRALRRGPLMVSRGAGKTAGLAAWGVLLVTGFFAALWLLDWTVVPAEAPAAAAASEAVESSAGEPAPETPAITTRTLVAALLELPVRGLGLLLGPQWYEGALYRWIMVVATLVAVTFAFGWFVAALRSGPVEATVRSGRALVETVLDLVRTSPRRVAALAWLAFRDSLRRRALVVFAVFLVLMAFAGWFISPSSDQPARLYLQVVLTTTGYLLLLLALFLSALSLPGDIKDRTIHTIVTKPVRASEIVLGRVLGFTLVGTLLLGGMAVVSYAFTVRGLRHTHQLTAAHLHDEVLPGRLGTWKKGLTGVANDHQHEVTIDPAGNAVVETKQGHTHNVSIEGDGEPAVYRVGQPQGQLVARVPVYGKLRFTDSQGREVEKGVNVGDEWTYRSFIQGGGKAAAIWTFEGIDDRLFPKSKFPDGIPLEMTIEVFRSHKGDVAKPILGTLWVRNPQTQRKVEVRNFGAKKFATDVQSIPRTLVDRKADGRTETIDLLHHFDVELPELGENIHSGELVDVLVNEGDRVAANDVVAKVKTDKDVVSIHTPRAGHVFKLRVGKGQTIQAGDPLLMLAVESMVSDDGRLEVGLQCIERAQYFGAAQADLYFRAGDASFFLNFLKAFTGLWLQMVLVLVTGVTLSTFLSAPVALVATAATAVAGLCADHIAYVAGLTGEQLIGGGPAESLIRIGTQQNMIMPLEPGLQTNVAKMIDMVMQWLLGVLSSVLPAFGHFDLVDYVAFGFDISWAIFFKCLFRAAAFVVPALVAGYLFLKVREVAK
ncbi:MAG: lipoyl domain-containing protein [Thermoguttaceae bacterium]|jgi:biotin carboxyl carrier protein